MTLNAAEKASIATRIRNASHGKPDGSRWITAEQFRTAVYKGLRMATPSHVSAAETVDRISAAMDEVKICGIVDTSVGEPHRVRNTQGWIK